MEPIARLTCPQTSVLLSHQQADPSNQGKDWHQYTEFAKPDAEDAHQADDDEVNGQETKTEVAGELHAGD